MKLHDHLQELGERPYKWAERIGVPKDAVYRHLKGRPIEYANAKKISEGTGGAVSVSDIMG